MPVFDIQAWYDSLKTDSPELAAKIPFNDIKGGFMRQDDYSRKQQELQSKWNENDQYAEQLRSAEQKLVLVQQLEGQYGPADQWSDALKVALGNRHPQLAQPDLTGYVRTDDVQAMLAQVRTELEQRINGVATGAAITIDFIPDAIEYWRETFNERFPKAEFSAFLDANPGLRNDPNAALKVFAQPKISEKEKADHQKAIEEARAAGRREALSSMGGVEMPTNQPNGLFFADRTPVPPADPATGQAPVQPEVPISYEARRHAIGTAYQQALAAASSGKVPGVTPGS